MERSVLFLRALLVMALLALGFNQLAGYLDFTVQSSVSQNEREPIDNNAPK